MDNFIKNIKPKSKEAYLLFASRKSVIKHYSLLNYRSIIALLLTFFMTFSYSQVNNSLQNSKEQSSASSTSSPANVKSIPELGSEIENSLSLKDLESASSFKIKSEFISGLENIYIKPSSKEKGSPVKISVTSCAIISLDNNQKHSDYVIIYSDGHVEGKNYVQKSKSEIKASKKLISSAKSKKINTPNNVAVETKFKDISTNSPFSIGHYQDVLLVALVVTNQQLTTSGNVKVTFAADSTINSKWLSKFYKSNIQTFDYYNKVKCYLLIREFTLRPPPFLS